MIAAPVVLSGACIGTGIAVVIAGLRPTTPDLTSALARLDPTGWPEAPASAGRIERLGTGRARPLIDWITDVLRLRRYSSDLTLLGTTPEMLCLQKLGYLLLGLAFPPILTTVMGLIGLRLPWVIPGIAALALAAGLFFIPDLDVRRRAAATRAELRQTVCAYIELVALERAADAGAIEALERAATIGNSPGFARINDALLRAELAGSPPWQGLNDLATSTGVVELGDVADIMRLSGEDGAAVYATLRARAAALRTSLLADTTTDANSASERMIIPVACLGLAFMVLIGYPAFARILFGP